MRKIAETTDGAYFRATDTNALESIYQRIDQLEKSRLNPARVMIPHPLYRWPLALHCWPCWSWGCFPVRARRLNRSSSMLEAGLHFAQPLWLWGLLVMPLVLGWLLSPAPFRQRQEDKYADPELLPT